MRFYKSENKSVKGLPVLVNAPAVMMTKAARFRLNVRIRVCHRSISNGLSRRQLAVRDRKDSLEILAVDFLAVTRQ